MSGISKKLMGTTAAAGEAFTAIEDVFSTYLYTGNGSSQVIENGINLGQSFGSGSVEFNGTNNSLSVSDAPAFSLGSNNYTIEFFVYPKSFAAQCVPLAYQWDVGGAGNRLIVFVQNTNGTYLVYYNDANFQHTTTATVTLNSWNHVALIRSGNNIYVSINGTVETASTSFTSTYADSVNPIVVGSSYNAGSFSLHFPGNISNLRVVNGTAVYTSNFTPPTSELTAISGTSLLTCQGADPFVDNSPNAFTITQNGNPQAATFGPFDAATPGEGGLVWLKNRGSATDHALFDTERGVTKALVSNGSNAEAVFNAVTAFNSDGFSLGSSYNGTGSTYASWTFRKAPRFFDVVTYTGDGTSGRAISHNLGTTVGSIIIKRTDTTSNWVVYHRGNTAAPETDYLTLNTTDATSDIASIWFDTAPTDSTFTVGDQIWVNASGGTYVAYLFAHDPLGPSGDGSDGLIACGSYTGNGGENPINLGWEPQWLLVKCASSDGAGDPANWWIIDNMRGWTADNTVNYLEANTSGAELQRDRIRLTPTGFTPNVGFTPWNASGQTYIYIAIRRGPMRQPTSGTEVFETLLYSGSGSTVTRNTNILVDALFSLRRSGGLPYAIDRMRGGTQWLRTSTTDTEGVQSTAITDMGNDYLQMGNGAIVNTSGSDYALQMFRRAPGFFDVVAYTGGVTANINHNLEATPEMYIVKCRTDGAANRGWAVYHTGYDTANKYIRLNLSDELANLAGVWGTGPTTTTFGVGSGYSIVNESGQNYIAYLFATLPGVSKVGSYTGNGSSQTINCGFTSGARFVLIKRTDSTGDWYVWDTARGIVTGNDPFLELNTTDAEVTSDDSIDPDSSGFIVNQTATTNVNVSSASYIFLAIA